jgi:hypothetical protein
MPRALPANVVYMAAMKIHLSLATLFCFRLASSLRHNAKSSLDEVIRKPIADDDKNDKDQRGLTAGALKGLVLYDTSTKTNITLTNNMMIVSTDPKYTVIALPSSTAGIESMRFRQVQTGKSTVYTKVENKVLYTLCGNIDTNMTTCSFLKNGTHILTVTAFSRDNAKGKQVGTAVTIAFTIAPQLHTKSPTYFPTKSPMKLPVKAATKAPSKAPTKALSMPPHDGTFEGTHKDPYKASNQGTCNITN